MLRQSRGPSQICHHAGCWCRRCRTLGASTSPGTMQLQNALELVQHVSSRVTEFVTGDSCESQSSLATVTIGYTVRSSPVGLYSSKRVVLTEPGRIDQVTSGGLTQDLAIETIADTSFRAATVTFVVEGMAPTDLQLGFFRTDGAFDGQLGVCNSSLPSLVVSPSVLLIATTTACPTNPMCSHSIPARARTRMAMASGTTPIWTTTVMGFQTRTTCSR